MSTQVHKGRAKTGGRKRGTGGRKRGTPNKPKSIKVAMREFTDKNGRELVDWANQVFESPDLIELGDKVVNVLPAKVALFRYALEYGIGTPIKQQPDAGKGKLEIVVKYPLGVDPVEMREREEALNDAREVQALARPGKKEPRPLTQALLKAARAVPELVVDPATGDELVPIADNDPDVPDRPDMDIPSQ